MKNTMILSRFKRVNFILLAYAMVEIVLAHWLDKVGNKFSFVDAERIVTRRML